jgi:site-specific DNA-methyltransferase (adenine-specific)
MPTVKLHRGDCLKFLKTLPAGSVDAIVTDPPYGMGWNTDSTRFSHSERSPKFGEGRDDYGAIVGDDQPFDPAPWLVFRKVVLWGSNHYAAKLPAGTTLVWLKKDKHLFGTFLSDAEIGWMKGNHGVYCHFKTFTNSTRVKELGLPRSIHPTQKPVSLMEWCISRLKLKPGSTIFDPFMGTGSTGVAAVRLGFNFIGAELDPKYVAVARRRIRAALSQKLAARS